MSELIADDKAKRFHSRRFGVVLQDMLGLFVLSIAWAILFVKHDVMGGPTNPYRLKVEIFQGSVDCSTGLQTTTLLNAFGCKGDFPSPIVTAETTFNSVEGVCSGELLLFSTDTTCQGDQHNVPMPGPYCFPSSNGLYSYRFTCELPTSAPSHTPTTAPSQTPTGVPSLSPTTMSPSSLPTLVPTVVTSAPSASPIVGSAAPSTSPVVGGTPAPSTVVPSQSPISFATRCAPFFTTDINVCRNRIALCGSVLKWTGKGCRNRRGRPLGDGGCQCVGYCGYKCRNACRSDPLGECRWDAQARVCRVKATGAVGGPIQACSPSLPIG